MHSLVHFCLRSIQDLVQGSATNSKNLNKVRAKIRLVMTSLGARNPWKKPPQMSRRNRSSKKQVKKTTSKTTFRSSYALWKLCKDFDFQKLIIPLMTLCEEIKVEWELYVAMAGREKGQWLFEFRIDDNNSACELRLLKPSTREFLTVFPRQLVREEFMQLSNDCKTEIHANVEKNN